MFPVEDASDIRKLLDFDPSKPVSEENGLRTYNVRCRIPFHHVMAGGLGVAKRNIPPTTTIVEEQGADEKTRPVVLETIASSTSVDFYETEMSILALQRMSAQMAGRIPFVPTHRDNEWHLRHTFYSQLDIFTDDAVQHAR